MKTSTSNESPRLVYKVMHIIGARPHFMKLAPVYKRMNSDGHWQQVVVHTGQHYDERLSDNFLTEFDLPAPDYNLAVGSDDQVVQIGKMLIGLGEVLNAESPDVVFAYGDTNSTAAAAIAAAKNNIPLGHVEAGLREFDKAIPEEVNKLLTDAVSDLFFCPTQTGVDNLASQGVTSNVHRVGDTVLDWLEDHVASTQLRERLTEFDVTPGQYYFMTCHRAANTEFPEHLSAIWNTVDQLSLPVIAPVHPRTRAALDRYGIKADGAIQEIAPIGFWDAQALIHSAKAVITDSGGVIKEAYFHRTPSIIVDAQTEWLEVVQEGWAQICGPDPIRIQSALRSLSIPATYRHVLGKSGAAAEIAQITKNYLDERGK